MSTHVKAKQHKRNLTQQLVREVPLAVYDFEGYILVRGTSTESEHNLRSAYDPKVFLLGSGRSAGCISELVAVSCVSDLSMWYVGALLLSIKSG